MNASDVGRPSEVLQAEYLAKFGQTAKAPEAAAPPAPVAPPEVPAEVAKEVSPPVPPPAPTISVEEFDRTKRLPLEALPTGDIRKLAVAKGYVGTKTDRASFVAYLASQGITDAAVE